MVGEHGGRIIDTAGDGILAEFASVLNAVKCAVAIQKTMAERNAAVDPARRMQFRIGINQGDVIFDEARVYGDGVNVAARLESIAEPGGICISGKVYRGNSREDRPHVSGHWRAAAEEHRATCACVSGALAARSRGFSARDERPASRSPTSPRSPSSPSPT